ncbi:PEP-CTERM protein-sorting domain-containing protein [Arsukibacterium tuosuense]|uniref:PEP-CTERM protein-sorting domain-containing protein n=1 Tax=Arsukibacterium tuosuense TaxID=1323745 RepID=A0A285I6Z9_9GAMM|nr:PEP-CTERM sorting domain-containing protein [Arsukibacterium tuosuense]SNY43762.1 PEP-CTERM protein-sorting domain-containing protein [Arsukibacterium tuosuense]
MNIKILKAALVSLTLAAGGFANATLITSDVGYTGPGLDLTAFQTGSYNFTFGPEAIPGGITFVAAPGGGGNSGQGSVIGQGSYGLNSNGSFGGDAVYIGVDSGTGYADLIFDTEISFFGAYMNYAPGVGDNAFISALDDLGNILETWDLTMSAPISTPGGFNEFEFRGIDLGGETFKTFRFGGNYLLLAATADGTPVAPVDPIVNDIPEPATLAIFGLGILSLSLRRFKKQ